MLVDGGAADPNHHGAGHQEPTPQPHGEAAASAGRRVGGSYAYEGPEPSSAIQTDTEKPPSRLTHASVARFKRDIAHLTDNKSLLNCGRRRAFHSSVVTLACDDKRATATGVMLCKNSHLCPACSPWLARRRAEVLQPQFALIDGVKVFVTLTIERHKAIHPQAAQPGS